MFNKRNVIHVAKPKQLSHFKLSVYGRNNTITIEDNTVLANTSIDITGDNNHLVIRKNARFLGPCHVKLHGNATVDIGENAGIRGVEFLAKDGKIKIGELCMFSYGIIVRTHDSHKIIDLASNVVTNQPKDVILGKHVWIAQNVTILKGVTIGDNSVLGFGSIITKGCAPNSIMVGVPAKVVKTDIRWDY